MKSRELSILSIEAAIEMSNIKRTVLLIVNYAINKYIQQKNEWKHNSMKKEKLGMFIFCFLLVQGVIQTKQGDIEFYKDQTTNTSIWKHKQQRDKYKLQIIIKMSKRLKMKIEWKQVIPSDT